MQTNSIHTRERWIRSGTKGAQRFCGVAGLIALVVTIGCVAIPTDLREPRALRSLMGKSPEVVSLAFGTEGHTFSEFLHADRHYQAIKFSFDDDPNILLCVFEEDQLISVLDRTTVDKILRPWTDYSEDSPPYENGLGDIVSFIRRNDLMESPLGLAYRSYNEERRGSSFEAIGLWVLAPLVLPMIPIFLIDDAKKKPKRQAFRTIMTSLKPGMTLEQASKLLSGGPTRSVIKSSSGDYEVWHYAQPIWAGAERWLGQLNVGFRNGQLEWLNHGYYLSVL